MDLLLIIIGMILLIFSIIDYKVKAIPSVFLTAVLFMIAFLNPANLWFGVMAFIMAWMLYELDFFGGIADIKVMTMIGLLISSTGWMLLYIGLIMVFGFAWKMIYKWRMRKAKQCPFVPVFLFVYIAMIILGGIR